MSIKYNNKPISFGQAMKEVASGGVIYWRTIFSIYVLGLVAAALGMGVLSICLSSFVGALLFHKYDRQHSKRYDIIFRFSLAVAWTWVLTSSSAGSQMVKAITPILLVN